MGSYDGCTLIYKCKMCDVVFRRKYWTLENPTKPIAFHKCEGFSVEFESRYNGIGNLVGIDFSTQGEEK